MTKEKQVELKITSAIAIGGEVVRPDTVVTVSDREARNLLQRGKAVLAVEGDTKATAAKGKAKAKPAEGDTETAAAE